jgi:hypothetical protein
VQYDSGCLNEVWRIQTPRYRVLEIYYDPEESQLPELVESLEESMLLSSLSHEVVDTYIWPLVLEGP